MSYTHIGRPAMEDGYTSIPTSHSAGSVPAAVVEESQGQDVQTSNTWSGYFSISSYQPYFNVDTDIVFDRLIYAVYPMGGFCMKIDSNPDMYGPVWISTTLVFILSALGNCAAYLMSNGSKPDIAWNFDVNYINWAACAIYGYLLSVPAAFYFLLRYFGSNAGLVKLWCIWGYSLFIFIPTALLLVIPVEILRWIIILFSGTASAYFIALNLKPYSNGQYDIFLWIICASVLQFVLAIFIKVFFFA